MVKACIIQLSKRYLYMRDVLEISADGTENEVKERVRNALTRDALDGMNAHLGNPPLEGRSHEGLKRWCVDNYHKGHPIGAKRLPKCENGSTLFDAVLWLRII